MKQIGKGGLFMEERRNPELRRRKKRSQFDQFKENYLPAVIICIAFLLVIIFTIGSVARGIQYNKAEQLQKEQVRLSSQQAKEQLNKEVKTLVKEAKALANDYDYDGAIAVLDSFSGSNPEDYPELVNLRQQCVEEKSKLVLWEDNSQVVNLSFHNLIVDAERAFSAGYSYHYITTTEFSNILLQLYQNDYVLISLDDIYAQETDDLGQTYLSNKQLYLPAGKKPLIITQNQVNYYTDMVDGADADYLPDAEGAGIANKLVIDENGNIACEYISAEGDVSVGAYDLVPILESFIATHPDFSYRGARAILSVTGYDGLFGYRTSMKASSDYNQDDEAVKAQEVIAKLRELGYQIACYTYGNVAYGELEAAAISADMSGWVTEVSPILGEVDIFVFAKTSDINVPSAIYSGEKFNKLSSMGFKYFIGFCETGTPWHIVTDSYVRQGRIMVTGNSLKANTDWYTGLFDAGSVIDPTR